MRNHIVLYGEDLIWILKIVILLRNEVIDLEKVKKSLNVAREFIKKVEENFGFL